MWGVYLGAILAAFGIVAVILYWRLRKKYKNCKENGRQELVNELEPSVMQINEPDYIKNEILSKMGTDKNEISEPDVRSEESKEEDTTTTNKDYPKDMGNQ